MNKARFRIWWDDNWLRWLLGIIGVALIVLLVAGTYVFIFQLESFQKQMLLAQGPIYFLNGVVHTLIFIFGYRFLMTNSLSKLSSRTKKINVEFVKVTFADVIGLEEAKREAQEVVS